MLGNWLAGISPRLRNAVFGVSAILLADAAMLITAELNFGFIPHLDMYFPPGKSPLLQAVDWDSLNGQLPAGVDAVAALRWYDAGKIAYALRGSVPVTVFGPEPHEFGISEPVAGLLGKNILLVAMPGSVTQVADEYAADFKILRAGPALVVTSHGDVLLVMPTFIGTDLLMVP
jgi:hypothetical protein